MLKTEVTNSGVYSRCGSVVKGIDLDLELLLTSYYHLPY